MTIFTRGGFTFLHREERERGGCNLKYLVYGYFNKITLCCPGTPALVQHRNKWYKDLLREREKERKIVCGGRCERGKELKERDRERERQE